MFRRRWSGLPEDPVFPANLKKLGYFINDQDEIRSIENPDLYFKYFLKKNDRWNEAQRFAMNSAVAKEVEKRLENQGCVTRALNTVDADESVYSPTEKNAYVPVMITQNAGMANHIVVVIGESTQDFGVLAHRVIGGPGGINKGSLINTVKKLRNGKTGLDGDVAVAIANPGECFYWPKGNRPLTAIAWTQKPRKAAVTYGERVSYEENIVKGHESPRQHIRTFFKEVVNKELLMEAGDEPSIRGAIKIMSIIAIGDSAEKVEEFLNEKENWDVYSPHLVSLALIGGFYDQSQITNPEFAEFLKTRARAYIVNQEPTDTPLATWRGNPLASHFTNYGCPVFSSGEPYYDEMMFITAHDSICDWVLKVARDPDYANPEIEVTYVDEAMLEAKEDQNGWGGDAGFDGAGKDIVVKNWTERLQEWNCEQAALGNKDLEKEQAEVAAGEASPGELVAEELAARCVIDEAPTIDGPVTGGSPSVEDPDMSVEICLGLESRISVEEEVTALRKAQRDLKHAEEAEELAEELAARCVVDEAPVVDAQVDGGSSPAVVPNKSAGGRIKLERRITVEEEVTALRKAQSDLKHEENLTELLAAQRAFDEAEAIDEQVAGRSPPIGSSPMGSPNKTRGGPISIEEEVASLMKAQRELKIPEEAPQEQLPNELSPTSCIP